MMKSLLYFEKITYSDNIGLDFSSALNVTTDSYNKSLFQIYF